MVAALAHRPSIFAVTAAGCCSSWLPMACAANTSPPLLMRTVIRRRHPKGTDFSKVSAAEIAATEEWINNYPRKILGYKSCEVMFRECLREIGLSA